jgi:hypothetical protein
MVNAVSSEDPQERLEAVEVHVQWVFDAGVKQGGG